MFPTFLHKYHVANIHIWYQVFERSQVSAVPGFFWKLFFSFVIIQWSSNFPNNLVKNHNNTSNENVHILHNSDSAQLHSPFCFQVCLWLRSLTEIASDRQNKVNRFIYQDRRCSYKYLFFIMIIFTAFEYSICLWCCVLRPLWLYGNPCGSACWFDRTKSFRWAGEREVTFKNWFDFQQLICCRL